jgi:hypothetical protein
MGLFRNFAYEVHYKWNFSELLPIKFTINVIAFVYKIHYKWNFSETLPIKFNINGIFQKFCL